MKKYLIGVLTLSVLTFLALALRPLPKASKNNCVKHSGIVSQVLKGEGEGDIVVKLRDDKNYYYINRAIDNGLSVENLIEDLVNKKVEILTIVHWTPLDPMSKSKHIAEIKADGTLVYSEM